MTRNVAFIVVLFISPSMDDMNSIPGGISDSDDLWRDGGGPTGGRDKTVVLLDVGGGGGRGAAGVAATATPSHRRLEVMSEATGRRLNGGRRGGVGALLLHESDWSP